MAAGTGTVATDPKGTISSSSTFVRCNCNCLCSAMERSAHTEMEKYKPSTAPLPGTSSPTLKSLRKRITPMSPRKFRRVKPINEPSVTESSGSIGSKSAVQNLQNELNFVRTGSSESLHIFHDCLQEPEVKTHKALGTKKVKSEPAIHRDFMHSLLTSCEQSDQLDTVAQTNGDVQFCDTPYSLYDSSLNVQHVTFVLGETSDETCPPDRPKDPIPTPVNDYEKHGHIGLGSAFVSPAEQLSVGPVTQDAQQPLTSECGIIALPEKHVASVLAGSTCTLVLTIDHLLVTGSLKKESRTKSEIPHQYGDSLTDRDLLDVPSLTDCNVRTAPSSPEVETKGLSRNAESTSNLEMAMVRQRPPPGGTIINGSRCSEPVSGQKTPQKEPSPKLNKSRNEKFHKIFKCVPEEEAVLKSYSCAYFGDILLQGFLYISPNWFCFYSKILGHEKHIEIPVEKVLNLTREKTAFIIPNAIGIVTPQDKYVFGSLMSRDSTYRYMWNVWKHVKAGDIGDKPDLDSDANTENETHISGSENNNSILKPHIQLHEPSLDSQDEVSSEASMCMACGLPVSAHSLDESCKCIEEAQTPDSLMNVEEKSLSSESPLSLTTSSPVGSSFTPHHHQPRHKHSVLPGFHRVRRVANKLITLTKANLLLALCTVLVVLLSLSAVIMTYKIVLLQARLDGNIGWVDSSTSKYLHSYKLYSDLYILNHQFHTSTIERFHSVLEANIQLLRQVHESLKSLQDSPLVANQCSETGPGLSNQSEGGS